MWNGISDGRQVGCRRLNGTKTGVFIFVSLFFFFPSPNLFQQLYQILTDFDIRFYMYELLKVSDIACSSLDGETRDERGSSGAHGAVLLSDNFSRVQCRTHVS